MAKQILELPKKTQEVVESYLKMRINNKVIACPYFINRQKNRGGLRVFLGKGTASEIINEVKFIAQKEQTDLSKLSEPELYYFMSKHNLGIDCSGLVVHILKSFFKEKENINFLKKIKIISFWKNPVRFLISKLRPVENIRVRILAKEKNSFLIKNFSEIHPGDLIIRTNLRHIYIIVKIEKEEEIKKLTFVHAPRPKQKNYLGPGVVKKTIIIKENSLKELNEKIKDNLLIKRLKI